MENKKGNTIVLTMIAIATLLVAIVGATFAYFTASITGNNTASSVIVNAASLGTVTYSNNTQLTLSNALPGASSDKITFKITASGNNYSIPYTIKWTNVSNDFVTTTDLVYYLSGSSSNGGTVVSKSAVTAPTAATTIGSGTLAANGDVHTYTMYLHFKETATDQNSNQGKSFVGKIEVTTNSGTTYYNSNNTNGTATKPTSAY